MCLHQRDFNPSLHAVAPRKKLHAQGKALTDSLARGIANWADLGLRRSWGINHNLNPANAQEILAHQLTTRKKYPSPTTQLRGSRQLA